MPAKGFTLFELLVVLVLMALIAAVSAPFLSKGFGRAEIKGSAQDVAAALRRARGEAVVGNADVVEAFWTYKTNVDSGMFDAVQYAGSAALTDARDVPQQMSRIYERRRDLVVDALRQIGLEPNVPKGSIFVWDWLAQKCFDGSAPLGPWITPLSAIAA